MIAVIEKYYVFTANAAETKGYKTKTWVVLEVKISEFVQHKLAYSANLSCDLRPDL